MKLLMTADTVGGVWTYALELVRALRPHGVEVALATMGAPLTAAQRAELKELGGVELFESEYRLEWMDEPWADVAAAGEWLLALEEQLRPDIVHLNGYAHGALPWRAPVLVVAHSCVLSWWAAVKGEGAPSGWDRYRSAVRRGLAGARLVVAPTRAMLAALEEQYVAGEGDVGHGAQGGRTPGSLLRRSELPPMRVVPNGRDPARFRPHAKEPFVFAAGRLWDEAKNVAALGRIAPRLSWPVYVAGADRRPGGGTVSFGEGGRGPGAHALGPLAPPALAAWLARASIYALPARYEPFGLSALEAALAGCALVLGDIPSLREVWGDAALFVPPDDSDALTAAIEGLIAEPARRASLAARSRHRALGYTPGRMAAGYVEAYGLMRDAALGTEDSASPPRVPRPASRVPTL